MNTIANRWLWMGIVLFGAVSYGILSPVIKLAYDAGLNELQVTYAQLIVGAAMLWLLVALRPKAWVAPVRIDWLRIGFVGFIGILLTSVFINGALMYLSASVSIVLLFQFTWITIGMECLLDRKKPAPLQLVAVGIVLIGTVLAVGFKWNDLSEVSVIGVVLGLLSSLTYSSFIVFAGRVGKGMDPVLKSAVMMTPFLPIALLIVWFMYPNHTVVQGDSAQFVHILLWGLALGLLAHAIPTVFFNIGIPRIGSSLAAMIGSAELPATVIGALLLNAEVVTSAQWFGIALIVVSIIVSERRQGQKVAQ